MSWGSVNWGLHHSYWQLQVSALHKGLEALQVSREKETR